MVPAAECQSEEDPVELDSSPTL
ncbi:TPA_asm: hypothetical protein HUJ06_032063 [Nelumbo nucifera]|uniref:Uncharacterized protein n=1 Tax=Nelumbo nucifera TaxID=4432 RepID=A0A822ZZ58_NELNU|nr:TPA_asm: hypothetical protein HUJ06_011571 [Nelumbo nucifera]DAD32723.1 TPA_asm: hypothetical protein HUJ06_011574 [Nelumbo nucifera]DAD37245.1 TPA_asm: hypothetical protein HUJ06_007886 [Nelumbo nucifera]DAD38659.1 TPA_asm: hypothetical protein HUJ06_012981 [Nelumbo nucifera]DAD47122.1 TPA_asm: hypothetical protein HUJ06_017059 [Nelumbo nucifera]